HALRANREECLQAGMDGYVPKPLNAKALFEAIENLASHQAQPDDANSRAVFQPAPSSTRLDRAAILARVEGDTTLLREVTDLFLEDAPRLLAEIRDAISRKDAKALERAAHALKGSIANFGAVAA